jgi:hypothetical protein
MTNLTDRAIAGSVVSLVAAATSWWDRIEQLLRMGASAVAIVSGVVVIWSVIRNQLKKKGKSNETVED